MHKYLLLYLMFTCGAQTNRDVYSIGYCIYFLFTSMIERILSIVARQKFNGGEVTSPLQSHQGATKEHQDVSCKLVWR